MIILTSDNPYLLHLASTFLVDLESLIHTIESHRSITDEELTEAREKFTDGLIQFLDDATVPESHNGDSTTAESESIAGIPVPRHAENSRIVLEADALSAVSRMKFLPSIDSEEMNGRNIMLPEHPNSLIKYGAIGNNMVEAPKYDTKSGGIILSGHLFTNENTTIMKSAQSQAISPYIRNNYKHAEIPFEGDSSILIRRVPTLISRGSILAQVCGGAVEGIELFPYQDNIYRDVSITFVLPSAAKAYLVYAQTPEGKLKFSKLPGQEFSAIWNPSPPRMSTLVTSMAQDPFIKARRCLIIKNFPYQTMDTQMLHRKLSNLEGKYSRNIEMQRITIDRSLRQATVIMDKISCALQVMHSKFIGNLGKEFDGCSLEYGEDQCDRPIPGTFEDSSYTTDESIAKETMLPRNLGHSRSDGSSPSSLYHALDKYRPSTQRTLYIPELPSNATISELVSQLYGGPLEKIILVKHKRDEGLAGCVTFVHPSSAKACFKHLTSPEGKLRFSGGVWDWPVNWDNISQGPINPELLEQIMDPAVNARRGFLIKNFPSEEVLVETLKSDALSQSQHILSFEKFEVNRTKHEGRVIMATVGAGVGALKVIKRLQRYRGCSFEYLKDECEEPTSITNGIFGKPNNTVLETLNDSSDVIDIITQSNNSPTTLVINDLPCSITLAQLSARIRGGALDSLQIHTPNGQVKATASVTFLTNSAAQNYLDFMMFSQSPRRNISWRPEEVSNVVNYSSKGARRVLLVKGFPEIFTKARIIIELERIVKNTTWKLKVDQKNIIESIKVRGDEKKEAKLVMGSIKLAALVKLELPKPWEADFGWDICEGDLSQLE